MQITTASKELDEKANIHSFSAAERAQMMRAAWQGQSRFQKDFNKDYIDLGCEIFTQSWREQIMRILVEKGAVAAGTQLEDLHRILSPEMKAYGFDDGVNKITTYLYDTDAAFEAHYHRFVKECLAKHFSYPFYFQATPTIRIHCPDGENNHHYPRYHTDIGYGHPPEEINIWIPLTAPVAPQQHGFRRASVEDSRTILEPFGYDFTPFIERAVNDKPYNHELNTFAPQVQTPLGKMHAFDSRCVHTGEPLEKHTRVSIDVRIMPLADFDSLPVEYQGTGRRRIRYVPGQAYHPQLSNEL